MAAVLAGLLLALAPTAGPAADPAATTREELIRKWDLNYDGSIDESEAELARSRMRRERAELRLKTGIDPLTGRPRGEPAAEPEPAASSDLLPPPPEPPAEPEAKPAQPGRGLPGGRASEATPPAASARSARPSGARPGYGSGIPRPDLNAGRLPAGLPGRRQPPASGGLLPNLRTRPPAMAPRPSRRTVDDYDVY